MPNCSVFDDKVCSKMTKIDRRSIEITLIYENINEKPERLFRVGIVDKAL